MRQLGQGSSLGVRLWRLGGSVEPSVQLAAECLSLNTSRPEALRKLSKLLGTADFQLNHMYQSARLRTLTAMGNYDWRTDTRPDRLAWYRNTPLMLAILAAVIFLGFVAVDVYADLLKSLT